MGFQHVRRSVFDKTHARDKFIPSETKGHIQNETNSVGFRQPRNMTMITNGDQDSVGSLKDETGNKQIKNSVRETTNMQQSTEFSNRTSNVHGGPVSCLNQVSSAFGTRNDVINDINSAGGPRGRHYQ